MLSKNNSSAHDFLFETIPIGVIYQDIEGRITSINKAASKILGLTPLLPNNKLTMNLNRYTLTEEGKFFPVKNHPGVVALETGQEVKGVIMGLFDKKSDSYCWVKMAAIPQFNEGELKPCQVCIIIEDITKQLLIERHYKESSLRLIQLFEHMTSGVVVYKIDSDENVVIKDLNSAAERLTGQKRENLIGKKLIEVFNHAKEIGVYDSILRVFKTNIEEYLPINRYTDSFIDKWFENYIYKLPNGEVVTLFNDVTTNKYLKDSVDRRINLLIPSDEKNHGITFEDLFNLNDIQYLQDQFSNATGVASVITDLEGNYITKPSNFCSLCSELSMINDKCCFKSFDGFGEPNVNGPVIKTCDHLGFMEAGTYITVGGEHVGIWFIGQVREDRQDVTDDYNKLAKCDLEKAKELFNNVPKMTKEKFSAIANSLFTIIQRLVNVIFQNLQQAKFIIEREVYEKKILNIQKFNQTIINNLPGLFYIIDKTTCMFIHRNTNWEEITGYSTKELSNKRFSDFFSEGNDRILCNESVEKVFKLGYYSMENKLVNKNGIKIPYIFTGISIIVEEKKCLLGMGIDIADRVKSIKEKELLEKRIEKNQRMDSLGQLAGGVAHNFNNLLMGILGYISVLKFDEKVMENHNEKIEAIETQINSAAKLTRSLLGFAKGGKYNPRIHNINNIIEATLSLFIDTRRDIIVHKYFSDTLWPSKLDKAQIEQVLLNIYINAIQAMPNGGNLSVTTENAEISDSTFKYSMAPGKYVKVCITDDGCGIKSKDIDKIFDPFYTTKGDVGSGMGLASSYGIIKNHKGAITVHSKKGKGSTFSIYLPATIKTIDDTFNTMPAEEFLRGERQLIVVVDDESFIGNATAELLEQLNYKSKVFNSGKTVLNYLEKTEDKVTLIILDMIMPDMSGLEVFEKIKIINKKLPVLFMSGYSVNGYIESILDQGCVGFLNKPFSIETLSKALHNAIYLKKK